MQSRASRELEHAERIAGLGSWVWTPSTGELEWSDNYFRLLGMHPGEITPTVEWFLDHVHEEDRPRMQEMADALQMGEIRAEEYRAFGVDGVTRLLRATVATIEENDGPLRIVGTVQDLTDQRRLKREMASRTAAAGIGCEDLEATPPSRLERDRSGFELAREAINERRLTVFSQPIVPLTGGEPAEELLVRIVGRDGEIIAPGDFLPAAEEHGLIIEIDRWMISQATRLAATGRHVALNLSTMSLGPRTVHQIETELRQTAADPAKLTFELTETAMLRDVPAGRQFAADLERIGCGFALDDFGTGFTTFTYLRALPADYLKIDIAFVRDITSNTTNQQLVKTIVHLARGLGMKTVAEGVESEPALDLLTSYGLDFAQGFHLGRPAPI